MNIEELFKIENVYILFKGALVVFAFLHLLAIITAWKQVRMTTNAITTSSGKKVLMFSLFHVIFLAIVLILIIILPSQ